MLSGKPRQRLYKEAVFCAVKKELKAGAVLGEAYNIGAEHYTDSVGSHRRPHSGKSSNSARRCEPTKKCPVLKHGAKLKEVLRCLPQILYAPYAVASSHKEVIYGA